MRSPALALFAALLIGLSLPYATSAEDPLDLALANMEDVLAKLDQQQAAGSNRPAEEDAQAQQQLQLAAQAQRSSQDPETVDEGTVTTTAGEAPAAILARVLNEAGLSEGPNGAERGDAYVAIGSAVVAQEVGKPGYAQARILAYHQAELLARSAMARSLASTVSSERMSELTATDATWDALLRQEGLDPAAVEPDQRVATIEQVVQRRTAQQAAAALSGCITFAVAEGPGPSGAQELHVALLWSPALAQLANDLLQHQEPREALPAGPPVAEQIPQDLPTLLRTMGVQPLVDEHGQRVLVAFAQAPIEAHSNPTIQAMRANHATERAQLEAAALLKEFLHTHTDASASSEMESLLRVLSDAEGNDHQQVDHIERFRQRITQAASSQTLNGLRPLSRWRGRINGAEVAGVVMLWSSASQALSKDLQRQLDGEAPQETPDAEADEATEGLESDSGSGHGRVPGAGSW